MYLSHANVDKKVNKAREKINKKFQAEQKRRKWSKWMVED